MEPLVALNRPDQVDSVPVFGVIDQWTYEGNLLAIERNRDLSLGLGKELQHQPTALVVDISDAE